MVSILSFLIAFDRDDRGSPCFLPVLPAPDFDPDVQTDRLEDWYGLMETEGAVAAKIERGGQLVTARTFTQPPDAPTTYMITHPIYAKEPYSATLKEIRFMLDEYGDTFVALGNTVLGINQDGIYHVAIRIQDYRRRAAGVDGPGVPVCGPNDHVPFDGTYIAVTGYHQAYRSPKGATTPNEGFRVEPYARDVIPFVDWRPLWDARTIDRFMALGIERAIEEAQKAIAQARSAWSYDPAAHIGRLDDGEQRVGEPVALYMVR